MYLILPTIVQHLVPDLAHHFLPTIFNFLMKVTVPVMTQHIHVQPVIAILISQSHRAEVSFFLQIIFPICPSEVGGDFLAFANLKQKVRFIHSEIIHRTI